MKIYLSGAMRGLKDANFPAFDFAAKKLRAEGHTVVSPADMDRRMLGWQAGYLPSDAEIEMIDIRRCLLRDCQTILEWADTVAVLPGTPATSKGAAAELALARAIQIPVMFLGGRYDAAC